MSSRVLEKGGQKKGLQYFWVLVILDLTFQMFNYLPIFDRHYLFWLIGFGLIFLYSGGYFRGKSFIWMLIYLIIVLINYVSGDSYFKSLEFVLTKETLHFLFPVTLTYYLFHNSDYDLFKFLLLFFGILLLESTMVSYWADSVYPGIMRLQSSEISIEANGAFLKPFMRIGLSDYGLPHAIPVLIPGIIYAIKRSKKKQKILLFTLLITSCVLVYVSASFTALLLAAFALTMSLVIDANSEARTRKRIVVIGIILIPFVYSTQLQLMTINRLQSVFPEESLPYKKFADIENTILLGAVEGSVEKRTEKYEATWTAVYDNIVFGTNDEGIGGHSAIPDRLAMLGLIGIIPYFLFLYYQSKFTLRFLNRANKFNYYVGLMTAFLMLLTKNMSTLSMWLCIFTFLPGLLWWSERDGRK